MSYTDRVTEAVLRGPDHTVTVPATGTWLVVDGVVHNVEAFESEDEHGGTVWYVYPTQENE